jgi:hypothetical protein
MFGDMINVGKEIPNKNHPHFQQLVNDLHMLEFTEDLAEDAQSIVNNPIILFTNCDIKNTFIKVDFNEIKNRFISPAFSPPGNVSSIPPDVVASSPSLNNFVCLDKKFNGEICGRNFASFRDLQLHRVNSTTIGGDHGCLTVASLVVCNCCPNCSTSFSSRETAKQHLRKAFDTGY